MMDFGSSISEPIVKAINAVMAEVKCLAKTEQNSAAGYRFTSVDDFLAAMNPLCAKAGLVILQDEEEVGLVEDSGGPASTTRWLWVKFSFTLAHISGDTFGPLTRSVMVPAQGAQAFGSAQSYALKQFMRSLFQIPTGDRDDVDFYKPEPIVMTARKGRPKLVKPRPMNASGLKFEPEENELAGRKCKSAKTSAD